MFLGARRQADDELYIVVKAHNGQFQMALGEQTRVYRRLDAAVKEASRLASKLNDGKYYVFQAVSVSEVVSPKAVTRALGDTQAETVRISTRHGGAE